MNRSMIWASFLAVAGVVIASNARATSTGPAGDDTGELSLQAPSDPSNSYPTDALVVKKTAETTFARKWKWDIYKYGNTKELYLKPYEKGYVDYYVTVTPSYEDSYWAVYGEITVYNPTSYAAKITSVTDIMTAEGQETLYPAVDCYGAYFPYKLQPKETLKCKYATELPNGYPRTNKAVVKTEGYVPGGYGTADVKFDYPTKVVDKCIDIYDDKYGTLGYTCAEEGQKKYEYSMMIEPTKCGDYEFKNTATYVTKDTYEKGSSYHSVYVKVPCAYGCTRTQGYWKNHSEYGPAKYDKTWAKLEYGAKTTFYKSGKSWYDCFKTAPAGNAYYILAHQYMAAMLNVYAGADGTPVKDTLKYAEEYFYKYSPSDPISKEYKSKMTAWASALDKYNNGQMGPQHCE